jgi:hypothetical protein
MGHMTGEMFIGDNLRLNIGFAAARARLGNLASGGVLLGASERAYGETITGLADAAGSVAGASQLAGVRPGDISETPGMAQLPVRWEATTRDGGLFPALEADLTLTPAGEQTTVFAHWGFPAPAGHGGCRGGPRARVLVCCCGYSCLPCPARLCACSPIRCCVRALARHSPGRLAIPVQRILLMTRHGGP